MTIPSRLRGCAIAALCATGALGLAVAPAAAAPSGFTITAPGVSSPVGMAADSEDDCYWVTDGSSASSDSLIAVDASGARVRNMTWQARTHSIQALSWANGVLYVGDIGDQQTDRSSIQVLSPLATSGTSTSWKAWDLTYPDGAHDADAMAVSPKGNIYVVTKGPSPAIYRSPGALSRSGQNLLEKVAQAPAGVTDAVFLPGGQKLAVRTASQVLVLDAFSWKTVSSGPLAASGGDALSTSLSGGGLVAGGSSAKVSGLDVPTGTASATASAKPTSTPSAQASDASSSSGTKHSGTGIALGMAVVMALVAGVVVHRVGRR